MEIAVLHGSPKEKTSVTMQYVPYIRFSNPSALEFFGQHTYEILIQPIIEHLLSEKKGLNKNLYAQSISQRKVSFLYETIFVRKNGNLIYTEVNGNRTTDTNWPVDLIIIGDSNECKREREDFQRTNNPIETKVAERTAELAVAKERAEESERLKSAFWATMSHELRTPLSSIIGFTSIILGQQLGPLNDEQRKQLTIVQDCAYHLLSLINDVLDLSKIEAGQLSVASETFDMRALVDQVVCIVLPLAEQKGLQINVQFSPEVGSLTSDSRRVKQILLNLLHNAIKFTPEGQVFLTCESDTNEITTTVKDTGIGIASKDLDKLFKAFQQIETGLSHRFKSSGLGLSICKKLVELLGGEIHAHSEGPGRGAAFAFTLKIITGFIMIIPII